jgi:hypothetical protein
MAQPNVKDASSRTAGSNATGRGSTTRWLTFIYAVLVLVGFGLVGAYAVSTVGPHWQHFGVGVLVGLAALSAGSLLGFLFGIPASCLQVHCVYSRLLMGRRLRELLQAKKRWLSKCRRWCGWFRSRLLSQAQLLWLLRRLRQPALAHLPRGTRELTRPATPQPLGLLRAPIWLKSATG